MNDKLMLIFTSVDWLFGAVVLIGGRYWGCKFFKVCANSAINFLMFATAFGLVYLLIKYFTVGIKRGEIVNLFITYLVVTAFYDLMAKHLFKRIEELFPDKKAPG